MKKLQLLALLFVALFSLTLTSCDDDDDDEPSNRALLTAGTWTAESVAVDGSVFTKEQILLFTGEDISTWTVKFNDDGTGTITIFGDSGTGEWRFADNEQTIVFGSGADESRAKINKLTSTELFLEFTGDDVDSGDFGDFGDTYEVRFKR